MRPQWIYKYASEEAESRAERASQSLNCTGAYMIVEDPSSGKVSAPTFLVRIGNVPEFDNFQRANAQQPVWNTI